MIRIPVIPVCLLALLVSACAEDPIRSPPCSGTLTPINPIAVTEGSGGHLHSGVSHERR
jgi:hypothetical protein